MGRVCDMLVGLAILVGCLWGCGSSNIFESQVTVTRDEKIRQLLDEGEDASLEEARDLLVEAIEEDPEGYDRHPVLAAVYARLAGIDLLAAAQSTFSGGTQGQGENNGVFGQLDTFLPSEVTPAKLASLDAAVSVLDDMPAEHRDSASTEYTYASSASFQFSLYQTFYATMRLKQFTVFRADGTLDPEALAAMTIEDARSILESLAGASSSLPEEQAALGTQILETLGEIDAAEGADDRERLQNFIANR